MTGAKTFTRKKNGCIVKMEDDLRIANVLMDEIISKLKVMP